MQPLPGKYFQKTIRRLGWAKHRPNKLIEASQKEQQRLKNSEKFRTLSVGGRWQWGCESFPEKATIPHLRDSSTPIGLLYQNSTKNNKLFEGCEQCS